ncbi:hypothetical protein PanWU01x14_341670 [Parasponia andersonii]|uniref:Uncharacterized protein n=1 Tax=Parasponia andersonii TaxID=3476 RepID=A0A2P5AE06_PARAD|nr:hypothetical protein PanWU01x14_341670 [Parasponia andersonii]
MMSDGVTMKDMLARYLNRYARCSIDITKVIHASIMTTLRHKKYNAITETSILESADGLSSEASSSGTTRAYPGFSGITSDLNDIPNIPTYLAHILANEDDEDELGDDDEEE